MQRFCKPPYGGSIPSGSSYDSVVLMATYSALNRIDGGSSPPGITLGSMVLMATYSTFNRIDVGSSPTGATLVL